MTENTISPTPIYWDGESPLLIIDSDGNPRFMEPLGFDIDEWFEERKEATRIRKARNA
jgi:hypothetical protein